MKKIEDFNFILYDTKENTWKIYSKNGTYTVEDGYIINWFMGNPNNTILCSRKTYPQMKKLFKAWDNK